MPNLDLPRFTRLKEAALLELQDNCQPNNVDGAIEAIQNIELLLDALTDILQDTFNEV